MKLTAGIQSEQVTELTLRKLLVDYLEDVILLDEGLLSIADFIVKAEKMSEEILKKPICPEDCSCIQKDGNIKACKKLEELKKYFEERNNDTTGQQPTAGANPTESSNT